MDTSYRLDDAVLRIASAIGDPSRARMLYCLMDNKARAGTELALAANISPSTASVHLKRLITERLVKAQMNGKHRFYSLASPDVADALERLRVLAGSASRKRDNSVLSPLRVARSCYDHLAGVLGVTLHDRLKSLGWLSTTSARDPSYRLTAQGTAAIDV